MFTSGLLNDQVSEIVAYNGTTKVLIVTRLTDVPSAGDSFQII